MLPRETAADIFDALIALLRTSLRAVAIVAVALALLALVLGRTDRLAALRGAAARRPVGWVAEHRGLLQGAAVALGDLVLLVWDPPTARVVLIDAALVAAAVALIAAVTRASVAPGAAPPAAPGSSP